MRKRFLLPLILLFPGIKFLSYAGLNYSSLDLSKNNIKQSLKPPVSEVFGLDLDPDSLEYLKKWKIRKLIKSYEGDDTLKKYVDYKDIKSRSEFINKKCFTAGKIYGFDNLISWDEGKPSKESKSYTEQLIEDLLKGKGHLNDKESKYLWGIVNNWDNVKKINIDDLSKIITKLKNLINQSSIKDKISVTSAANRSYNEYDAVNIVLQMSMTALYELNRVYSEI